MHFIRSCFVQLLIVAFIIPLLGSIPVVAVQAADDGETYAFPEKFMLRLSSYRVENADTTLSVLSDVGLGTAVSFNDDLGGEDTLTVPRIDIYYRFNERHRIEFSHFSYHRDGRKLLQINIEFEDEKFTIGETVLSDINYEVLRFGYAYSFYHSPIVELSLTAGLSINSYDFDYSLASGASSSDVSAPLPTFGLRVAYKINPKWSLRYVSETFFIEIDDALKGTLLNYELDIEYRLDSQFILGAGIARTSADLDVDDGDWKGRLSDSNRGLMIYGAYYF